MIRRSCVLFSRAGRTVVRDPRKAAKKKSSRNSALLTQSNDTTYNQNLPAENHHRSSLPFQPSDQNQQSVGSTLVSYALAGVGVAMGATLVGALFGGF